MIMLSLLVTDEIKAVVTSFESEDKALLHLLESAYAQTRYRSDYVVDEQSVLPLKDLAKRLLTKIEQEYQKFMENKATLR